MRRLVLAPMIVAVALAAAGGAAQAAPPTLPSSTTPNSPGSVVLTFALRTPPAVPETRSYAQLLALWKEAGAAYGVPWEVLGAINKIESNFGRNMGPSSAGALGWMQFMPSTWERWGMDGNGDGVASPWNPEDGVYSAARYLAAAGAASDLRRAIFAYNHADWYVNDVLELAAVFAGGGGFDPTLGQGSFGFASPEAGADAVFRLDSAEKRLADARKQLNRAQRAVTEAEARAQELDSAILEAEQRAGDPNLSDEEFQQVEAEVTQVVLEHEAQLAVIATKRQKLGEIAQLVEDLRRAAEDQERTYTFSRAPGTSGFGSPQFSGGYVFPVGGGASVVSVGADHHDYPAADIAAPEGSPLYALADGIVRDVYPSPTGRCGIGFSIQVADGSTYLYCHLSYLDPIVQPGTPLIAATPVGLVGSTGNSTGPHLHLQLVPASQGYPQKQPWFQAFAGTAFSWQGAPPQGAGAGPPTEGPVITFSR
jgi:murein DD-endopeptidase MepM/ murein hydrolase activator NlpD